MDGPAHWNITDWQRIARANRCVLAGHQSVPGLKTTRCNDVATLAISVAQQCNVRATVRIIFQALYTSGNTTRGASKINISIMFSMPAAAMAYCKAAMVVTARAAPR